MNSRRSHIAITNVVVVHHASLGKEEPILTTQLQLEPAPNVGMNSTKGGEGALLMRLPVTDAIGRVTSAPDAFPGFLVQYSAKIIMIGGHL